MANHTRPLIVLRIMSILRYVLDLMGTLIFGIIYGFCPRRSVPPVCNLLLLMPIKQLIEQLKYGEITCHQLVTAYIERQVDVNPQINAVVFNLHQQAIATATTVDTRIAQARCDGSLELLWQQYPLLGIPVTIKESFAIEGCPNSTGLVSRRDHRCSETSVLVRQLRQAGVVVLGLTNTSELCMWWESHNRVYGRTRNPYDVRRIVGGSSGGEGAIITAGGSLLGLGSDIGGSIRMPAHFNGLFGHKASTKCISNEGQFPEASGHELDFLSAGPLCRYASDMRAVLQVLVEDPEVSQRLRLDRKLTDIRKLRLYYLNEIDDKAFTTPVDKQLLSRMHFVLNQLRVLGCRVEAAPSSLAKSMRRSFEMWNAMMDQDYENKRSFAQHMAGVHSNQEPGVCAPRELMRWLVGCSPHTLPALALAVAERILAADKETNAELCASCERLQVQMRALLSGGPPVVRKIEKTPTNVAPPSASTSSPLQDDSSSESMEFIPTIPNLSTTTTPMPLFPEPHEDVIEDEKEFYSLLVLPTHPTSAPYHNQPLFRPGNFSYTGIFNVLKLPATVVPMGLDSSGLPISMQLVGDIENDWLCLSAAEMMEQHVGVCRWISP